MNRNQKIALGCGGAGCLGLIVVAIAGVFIYYFSSSRTYSTNSNDYNLNVNTNQNSNSNDSADANDNSSSTSTGAATSLSNDDKHKLYQAAAMTGDHELVRRVSVKIGLMDDDYTPGADYQQFLGAHVTWVLRNTDFIQSLDTPAKARAYVDQNIPD